MIFQRIYFMCKGGCGFYMNETTEKTAQTNLKFCPQCDKDRPYVNNYVTGSIRCANYGYYYLKQY